MASSWADPANMRDERVEALMDKKSREPTKVAIEDMESYADWSNEQYEKMQQMKKSGALPKDRESPNDVIAIIFSKTEKDQMVWLDILCGLTEALTLKLGGNLFFQQSMAKCVLTKWLHNWNVAEVTLQIPGASTLPQLKQFGDQHLAEFEKEHDVEVLLQPKYLYLAHQQPGLAVFDMDSTLIQQEVIDEIARAVGKYDECAAITAAAMRGEEPYTDFQASLKARVKLLEDVPLSIYDKLKKDVITFTPGARELIKVLNHLGWVTAVLSGGFMPLAQWVKTELKLDYALANFLEEDPERGCLTGRLVPGKAIVDGEMKMMMVDHLTMANEIDKTRVIAVGDGSNDLPMMRTAGLGIAFHAKPLVQKRAPSRLNQESLLNVLYALGYTKDTVDAILRDY